MFSVIVAWIVFLFISVVLPAALLAQFINRPNKKLNTIKVTVFILLWFVSGVYLFG